MCDHLFVHFRFAVLAAMVIVTASATPAAAEYNASELLIRPPGNHLSDPFESDASDPESRAQESFAKRQPTATVEASARADRRLRTGLRQVKIQPPPGGDAQSEARPSDLSKNPCAAMDEKPLGELGIGIALPEGKLPDDFATACWNQLNTSPGPLTALRCWSSFVYNWNATCLCHRPLYFEQINLERHGYGCCESLQPLASAAHFFATVPALPYCMAVECPCECVYTLGHYRPGSCPPWRHHWPPCSPLAAAAEGGVWTGMIFLIP